MLCLGILLPVSFLLALSLGTIQIPFLAVVQSLFGLENSQQADLVVQQIRMPRALLAAFVGATLGICGAATQGLFRNPLADPSLIGVTAGASAGAALTIFFAASLSSLGGLFGLGLVSVGAFIGGVLTVLLVYTLATHRTGTSVATMLLTGIAVTALAGGITSLIEYFANNDMLRRISLWRMGGLDGANSQRVWIAGITCLIILLVLPRFSKQLNALLLGESEARHLGVAVQETKITLIILVAAGVAISVSVAGSISFVGLIVPHIVRLSIGPDHRYLLPMSAIAGAILLLLADTLARTVAAPVELPVGVVTALLGAPFFISLLRHREGYTGQL
jgi:iron complex transport system permease protein